MVAQPYKYILKPTELYTLSGEIHGMFRDRLLKDFSVQKYFPISDDKNILDLDTGEDCTTLSPKSFPKLVNTFLRPTKLFTLNGNFYGELNLSKTIIWSKEIVQGVKSSRLRTKVIEQ